MFRWNVGVNYLIDTRAATFDEKDYGIQLGALISAVTRSYAKLTLLAMTAAIDLLHSCLNTCYCQYT